MTTPKKNERAPKRKPGYLVCDRCKRSVPYQGMEGSDPAMDGPAHRCVGHVVHPFDRFTTQDPNRLPIPEVAW